MVDNITDKVHCFASAPYLNYPTYDSNWLTVGRPLIKLDPISGEGTPFALRSAILAAAVIDGICQNPDRKSALLNHYQHRLLQSFISHLQGCQNYYHSAFASSNTWEKEIGEMAMINQYLSESFSSLTKSNFDYQLVGWKLGELAKV